MDMQKTSMEILQKSSFLDIGSAPYLEQLYQEYLQNREAVLPQWRQYFDQLPRIDRDVSDVEGEGQEKPLSLYDRKQIKVQELIEAYRLLGHLHAEIDPLKMRAKALVPELMLSYYHLSESDLQTVFNVANLPGPKTRSLEQILEDLKKMYCGTIASEFMHIPDSPERIWVQEKIEELLSQERLPEEIRRRILVSLTAAEGLEKYLGAKYPGAKRFSLEGTDSLIVALDVCIQEGGIKGVKEIVICMAHRGRLNLLVNLLGKMPSQLFDEFEGKHYDEKLESGDVKYHQGFSSDISTLAGPVHLSLAFNPSHLEIVTPVICGSVRARQEKRGDNDCIQVLPIALHGDASFAGQGVVMEILNMSKTRGFRIGGTIHIVIDNQIGFTTSDPSDARSTLYCSDIGKMMGVPIFHVNADDPEAVFEITQLALAYREKFKKDIIIDLVGYRRHGHNEADEPSVTQPIMYDIIRGKKTAYKLYADRLILEKTCSVEEVEKLAKEYRDSLTNRETPIVQNLVNGLQQELAKDWASYFNKDWRTPANTNVTLPVLKELSEKQLVFPKEFVLHPRVKKIIEDRKKMAAGELPVDWGFAETLAYATLLTEGYPVRVSGQDSARGTFFHRQAVLHNQESGEEYTPLCFLSKNQAPFTIVDSLLSEEAVLAFEYGYATTQPRGLVIWEAQFGDFANNAQVVIDQFISSGEQKWGRHCGVTLFLPHGYEGQGPEHSSARLERYLQLCAQENMQICIPSTPAQVFHMLRRQVLRPLRKPLIVLTPKSLLWNKLVVSTLEELSDGRFMPILPETENIDPKGVKSIILCSGKIYYDLWEKRRSENRVDVSILRIEQLYPFPEQELGDLLKVYTEAQDIVWCQEEPKNQGAWYSIQHHFLNCLSSTQKLRYAGREASASPAVGYLHLHQEQQKALVEEALHRKVS